jgi:hypothetical protein
LVKASGFILVSEFLPGIISASSKAVKYTEGYKLLVSISPRHSAMAGFAILDTFLAHAPISRVFGRSVQFLGLFRISRNGPQTKTMVHTPFSGQFCGQGLSAKGVL